MLSTFTPHVSKEVCIFPNKCCYFEYIQTRKGKGKRKGFQLSPRRKFRITLRHFFDSMNIFCVS